MDFRINFLLEYIQSCDAGDVASLTNAVKSNVVASHGAAYNPTWTCAAGFAGGPFTIRTTCAHGTVRQPPTGAACIPVRHISGGFFLVWWAERDNGQ